MKAVIRAIAADRLLLPVLLSSLAPWWAVILFCSGPAVLVFYLLALAAVAGIGRALLAGIAGPGAPADRLLLSTALGFVVTSSTIALGARLGVQPVASLAVLLLLAVPGLVRLGRELSLVGSAPVPCGLSFAVLSWAVCLVYCLPGSMRDGVTLPDGGFQWLYLDTQYYTSMAASLKEGVLPPHMFSFAPERLRYHFGPYAFGGAISELTGISAADSVVRVVRPIAYLALFAATIGLGRVWAPKRSTAHLSALLALIGLFFYGSIGSLFSIDTNGSSSIHQALLFHIRFADVIVNGGPFAHLILGHSTLFAMVGFTSILCLLVQKLRQPEPERFRFDLLIVLPPLMVATNSVAGLGATGIVAACLVIYGYRRPQAWLSVGTMLGLLVLVWETMGFARASLTSHLKLVDNFPVGFFDLVIWFFVGLGVRIICFRQLRNFATDSRATIILFLFAGYLFLADFLTDEVTGNTRYGFYYLQALLSVFAFSNLPEYFTGLGAPPVALSEDFAADFGAVLLPSGLFFGVTSLALYLYGLATSVGYKRLLFSALVSFAAVAASLLIRFRRRLWAPLARPFAVSLLAAYALGLFAWIPPVLNYGWGRMEFEVRVSAGEVKGLQQVRRLSGPNDVIATNNHLIPTRPDGVEGSYSYSALSERPMLAEGSYCGGERFYPTFDTVRHDNDMIFSTTNPAEFRRLVDRYDIRFVVSRPGTDINLPVPRPPWLVRVPETGTLSVYRIQPAPRHASALSFAKPRGRDIH